MKITRQTLSDAIPDAARFALFLNVFVRQPAPPRRRKHSRPLNALRILHVDDEVALTTIFQIVLEGTGRFVVREESSGTKVLEAARDFRPDQILLDKEIGSTSGEEVAARLQEDPALRLVPIAFVTGGVTRAEAAAEAVPTLPKPVSPSELLGFVDDLLNFNAVCVGC